MTKALRRSTLLVVFSASLLLCTRTVDAAHCNSRLDGLRSSAAAESEGEAHGAIFRWINFFLLAGALAFVLRKPLKRFFSQRSEAIQKSLEEGRKALEASQAQLKAVEEKLRQLEEEIAAFKAAASREMEEEHERLRQATAREAEKMLQVARAQLETATKAALLDLRLYAAQQAVELAGEMVRRRLDEASRRQLVSRFIAKLETPEKPN